MKAEWSKLPATDLKSIALSILREGNKQDHALAAFYLLATGDAVEARARLGTNMVCLRRLGRDRSVSQFEGDAMRRLALAAVSVVVIVGVSGCSKPPSGEKKAPAGERLAKRGDTTMEEIREATPQPAQPEGVPDLTKGEGPTLEEAIQKKNDWYLHFCETRGWIYRDEDGKPDKARQILITRVPMDSAVRRQLKAGDVILGVNEKYFNRHAVYQFREVAHPANDSNSSLSVIMWRKTWKKPRIVILDQTSDIVDFTKGDRPGLAVDWNLGATGARGWMYGKSEETFYARQILITKVHDRSPADGILEKDDVILGVDGKKFDSDARMAFGKALTRAETREAGGQLRVLRWRNGETKEVVIQLNIMGSYSKTTPWDCQKSQRILDDACGYLIRQGANRTKGTIHAQAIISSLALMATGNKNYMPIVREHVYRLVEAVETNTAQGKTPPIWGYRAWGWGYGNLLLSEYYLLTKDEKVLPSIEAYSNAIALGQSDVGSWGHGMSLSFEIFGKPHGRLGGYGAVNQAGNICWISLMLAKKCGVTNAEIEQAIVRGHAYLDFFVGKQTIPYGDMVSWNGTHHDDNGHNSSAAVGFSIFGDEAGTEFFTRMTVASHAVRERGHTGNWFSFLWGPLGAARSGQEGCSAFLHEIAWLFDMERRWDGGFVYQGKPGVGNGYYTEGNRKGTQKNNAEHQYPHWDTTGSRILMYCLPRKVLHITGKDVYTATIPSDQIADVVEAGRVNGSLTGTSKKYDNHTVEQLFHLLRSWSPAARNCAAMSLAKKDGDHTARLLQMLHDSDKHARYGACAAFREMGPKATAAVDELVKVLDSRDQVLQINAILALGASGDKKAVAPLLTMAARELPDDKREALHRYLGHALFLNSPYNPYKGLLAESIEGVDHALLQPAVSRLLRCVDGQVRGFVTAAVLEKLAPAQLRGPLWASMVRSLKECAPTFVMAASSSRMAFAEYLAENKIEEGLELLAQYIKLQKWHGCKERTPRILALIGKYGVHAKRIVPDLEEHVRYLTSIAENEDDGRSGDARSQIPLVQEGIAAIRQLTAEPELISIKQ